ncbi:MAG: hypothetical protein DRQ10_03280 [Candidatus Hydrothermota bacterium]|nr:MAG: hypothetical protein DRQ10_03280 [Candidatus Hydrothermae bacterium]
MTTSAKTINFFIVLTSYLKPSSFISFEAKIFAEIRYEKHVLDWDTSIRPIKSHLLTKKLTTFPISEQGIDSMDMLNFVQRAINPLVMKDFMWEFWLC